jgi:selenocysteine lyase/cysteine desulfurase
METQTHPYLVENEDIINESGLEQFFQKFRKNIIGNRQTFTSPFGEKELVYTDWTASGRAYQPIEDYIQKQILPFVGNTHTETTVTGTLMSAAYEEAKCIIKHHVNANEGDALIFCGSGMTAAVNKLQRILGIRIPERLAHYIKINEIDDELRPVVFVTHMEHHSNHVSWLETIATVEIIKADENGNVDLVDFETLLQLYKLKKNKIAAVTACSNVTGIEIPYHQIAQIIHRHGGSIFVDFACSAPYVEMDMHPTNKDEQLDAIYFSGHKFLGGPGSPGVLIFNKALYKNAVPDQPGGGTVNYTNPWGIREYIDDVEQREDGGTPPFLQGIKAAMCVKLKEAMGIENMRWREEELLAIIFKRFAKISTITILQGDVKKRLGVVSFVVKGAHHDLFVKILNDRFGIQTRGGCSCAGTYGHMLLGVDEEESHEILSAIRAGDMLRKPGWVRLSIHPTMTNAEIEFIVAAIKTTALCFQEWKRDYSYDPHENKYCFNKFEVEELPAAGVWFDVDTWY